MKILVVHKNEFLCRQLVKQLKAQGYTCFYATKDEAAWKKIKDKEPDILLGETKMTNTGHLRLLEKIKTLGMTGPEIVLLDSLEKLARVKTEKKNMDEVFAIDELDHVLKHFDHVRQSKKVA